MFKFAQNWNKFKFWLKSKTNRNTFANLLMVSFIMFTSIGAGLIFPPAGLITAGVACGILGFLLGSE